VQYKRHNEIYFITPTAGIRGRLTAGIRGRLRVGIAGCSLVVSGVVVSGVPVAPLAAG
jgi:hypothetical protein